MIVPLDELLLYLRTDEITVNDDEVEAAGLAASTMVEQHCARSFTVPTAATERVFKPRRYDLVKVDDIANTTDLVIVDDGTTLSSTQYQLETSPGRTARPDNSGLTRPYCYIRRIDGSWTMDEEATLSVTARWGWPAVPDGVSLAVKILTKDLYSARDTWFGRVAIGEFPVRIADNTMVRSLLAPYRAAESWGIA